MPAESRDDQRPLIILVEEETAQRKVLAEHLNQAGFAVLEAGSSEQALVLLEDSREISGVVTDAHVPGRIDGFELASVIRRDRPQVAVVMMSGHSDPTSGPVPDGAAFINKPNLLEHLAPTLRRLIGSNGS